MEEETKKEEPRIKVETGNTELLKVRFLSEISHHLSRIAKALEKSENK